MLEALVRQTHWTNARLIDWLRGEGRLALLRTGLADREIDYLRMDGSAHR